MKRKVVLTSFHLILALAMIGIVTVYALESDSLSWWTVDGGGGTFSSGGTYSLGGTIGQHDAGSASGGTYTLVSGFWGKDGSADVTPPTFTSIVRADSDPTNASSVDFTVTFSESVTNVDANDFTLVTSGVTGASITGISGSDATRTVTVDTGSGYGTVRLDVPDTATIIDMSSNPLIDLPFTTGQSYTIAILNFLPLIMR